MASDPRPGNLQPDIDIFVGRVGELAALLASIDAATRLVTVRGPGGVGKTRLALAAAARRAVLGAEAVWFCELQVVSDGAGLVSAIGDTIGLPIQAGDAAAGVAAIGRALRGRGPTLLVLDHPERVATELARASEVWRRAAPELVLLVTSRSALRATGEVEHELGPMTADDAVALFRARAPSSASAAAAEELTRLVEIVDRLPLAIELLATRAGVLAPRQIEAELRARLGATGEGAGALLRPIASALDWSVAGLAEGARAAFEQMGVFRGSFSLGAADAVLQVPGGAMALADALQTLQDHSLLRSIDDGAERRFVQLALVRDYAWARLVAAGAAETVSERLFSYFEGKAVAWAATIDTQASVPAAAELVRERDNCLAAIAVGQRIAPARAVQMASVVFALLASVGPFDAQLGVMAALDPGAAEVPRLARARFHLVRGTLLRRLRQADRAREEYEAARAACGDDPTCAGVACRVSAAFGVLHRAKPDMDAAREALAQAEAQARQAGNGWALGSILSDRAVLDDRLGRWAEATAGLRLALECCREAGDAVNEANILSNLGSLLLRQGELEEAGARLEQALEVARRTGNQRAVGGGLTNLGQLAQTQDRLRDAIDWLRQALPIHRALGEGQFEAVTAGLLAECLAHVGDGGAVAVLAGPTQDAREAKDDTSLGALLLAAGDVALAGRTPTDGEPALRESIKLHAGHQARFEQGRGECLLAELLLGRGAIEETGAALDRADAALTDPAPPALRALAALIRAAVELRRGNFGAAVGAARGARALAEVAHSPALLARAQAIEAEALAASGRTEDAEAAFAAMTGTLAAVEDRVAYSECAARRARVPRPGPPAPRRPWGWIAAACVVAVVLVVWLGGRAPATRSARTTEPPALAGPLLASGYAHRRALVVGINDYPTGSGLDDLTYARADATAIADVLKMRFGFTVDALYDDRATRTAILGKIEDLHRELGVEDQFLFFFAGHGETLGSGAKVRGFLVPADGTAGDGRLSSGIDMVELREQVGTLVNAKHKLLMIDACYGGMATRAVLPEPPRGDYFEQLTRLKAYQIFTAGGAGQKVLDGEDGHSIFTREILRVLEARALVTAQELAIEVKPIVMAEAERRIGKLEAQVPVFDAIEPDGDFVFKAVGDR